MQDRRNVLRMGLATVSSALAASMCTTRLLAQASNSGSQDLNFVAPELRPFAKQILGMMASIPPVSAETLTALRASGKNWTQPPLANVSWQKRLISGTRGNPDVTVFVINAKSRVKRGGIIHMHGGGFVFGAAALEIRRLQELARTLDCTIISVEYRLAPESR